MGRTAWGATSLLLGLVSLAAGRPQDWLAVACFAALIFWLEGFRVELGAGAGYLPARAAYLGAALCPPVGPAFASLMCLSECALRHQHGFFANLEDRIGVLAALLLALLVAKMGLTPTQTMLVGGVSVPLLCAFLTVAGPARQRERLSSEDRLRWQRARLHTRRLEFGVVLAAPALAFLGTHWAPLILLLGPALASTRWAGQSLVIEAQRDHAGEAFQALNQAQAQQKHTVDRLHRAEREKRLLEGFAAHLSGRPSLSQSAVALVQTVLELLEADDVALFLAGANQTLEPFHYKVQPEHQTLLQGSLLTGLREPLVDAAWQSQQVQRRAGSLGTPLFQRNQSSLAIPLDRWGVLYVGRINALPFSPSELEWLHWLGQKACLSLQVSLREQQARQLQQGQRQAIAGLQRQLEISTWLMESARKLSSALLVQQVVVQFAEILGATLQHQQRFLYLEISDQGQFLALPEEAASAARCAFVQELASTNQPLLIEDLSGTRQAHDFPEMKSLLGVPLLSASEKIRGAVLLASTQAFSREQSEVLFLLASQATMALSRAILHEQVLESRRQLEASQAQLIQSSKLTAIGQLAAGIAHELNTPLASVGLSLTAARENFPSRPERALKMFERGQEGLNRALGIIDKLLVYSRRPAQEFVPVDVTALVQDTLELIAYPLNSASVRIEQQIEPALRVLGRPQELQQVLVNLILNALQAVAEQEARRKIILIRGWLENGEVKLEIHDRGQGISATDLERIFEPFFTTKPVGKGTGLGLSISHQIVDLHRGKLEVSASDAQGSTFRITLPADKQK